MKKQIKCMKDLDIFSSLDALKKQEVVKLAQPRFFKKGESIFNQGDPCDTIYFIRSGNILLYKVSDDGKEISLDILRQDDILGENTIFDNVQHTFSAKAIENSFICTCSRTNFLKLLKNPEISIRIIQDLTNKLNGFTEQMANIAFNDVKGRVMNTIKRLAKKYGKATPNGVKLNIYLSHQDIANLVNASRVMVTNVLNSLKNEGVITVKERYLILTGSELTKYERENII